MLVRNAVPKPPMHGARDLLRLLRHRTQALHARTLNLRGAQTPLNKPGVATKLVQNFWKTPSNLFVHDTPVAHLGPDVSAELIALAKFLEERYITAPHEDVPHANVYASLFSPSKAQVDLKFNNTFSGFHVHPGFAAAANYLLPSASGPSTWVGYFWDEARAKLGPEKSQLAMKNSDIATLKAAGVELFTVTQKPGDFIVTHPLCTHLVCFSGGSAAHLAWFLQWITADVLKLYLSAFSLETCHLPLLQYDMEIGGGGLGLQQENEKMTELAAILDERGFLVTKLHNANLTCVGCERFLDRFCVGRSCLMCFALEMQRVDNLA